MYKRQVQVEETELEPPTLEMERPVQTAEEIEEQTGEEPIQMVDQTENPEPEKITGSVDANIIMMMFRTLNENMNKNRQEDKEETKKSNEQMLQRMDEKMNKNTESLKEENKKCIESLKKEMGIKY